MCGFRGEGGRVELVWSIMFPDEVKVPQSGILVELEFGDGLGGEGDEVPRQNLGMTFLEWDPG